MKLFGSTRGSAHSGKGPQKKKTGGKRVKNKKSGLAVFIKVIVIILAILLALFAAAYTYYRTSVKPPDVSDSEINRPRDDYEEQPDVSGDGENSENASNGEDNNGERTGGKYTFLVLGMDDGNGNTDTMMVATFDTNNYSLNIVSIPRDTLVNVSWSVKKANSFYGVGGVDRVLEGMADIVGYDLDFYVVVNLDAFTELVNAIGGVWFDVPKDMNYDDDAQNLHIHLSKGYQCLNGEDAVKLMRFRSGYGDADIGRINTQQNFMKAAAEQIIQNAGKIPITTLANTFINHVKTDLSYGNIIWFAKEFFKMDSENIQFFTIPADYNDACYHGGKWNSYVTIHVDEWLELINERLNPFDDPIEETDLDILTRGDNGKLYATSGVLAYSNKSWGSP